jgi:peptide/nickel transport system substrate-binding protein
VMLLAACGPAAPAAAPTSAAAPPTAAASKPVPATAAPAANTPVAAAPTPAANTAAPAAPISATAPTSAAPKPAVQPKTGGIIRVALSTDIANLEPHINTGGATESIFPVFDRLTQYDSAGKPQPQLAESWEVSPDSKQVKLNLRKNVLFHTGREFTSDDVKDNLLRVRDPKIGSAQYKTLSEWFPTIETPDKYTVIVKSEQARPLAFDLFEVLRIGDKVTLDGPDAKSKAVGTGAFTLTEWQQGSSLTLTKNKNYWENGLPYLDGIKVSITRDAQAMLAQLESAAVDVTRVTPLRDFARLKADTAQYQTISDQVSGSFYQIGMNVLNPPLDNKKVRQALNYAIDRKRFVDSVLVGATTPQSLPWYSYSPAYDPATINRYSFDLDKARALLAEAGVTSMEFDMLPSPTLPDAPTAVLIYQADLAKIGVKLNIRNLDNAAWIDEVNNRKYNGMYFSSLGFAQLSPGFVLTAGRSWDPTVNNSGFKSDTYSQLVTAIQSEIDPAKQKDLYKQINEFILDESFIMPLASNPVTTLLRSNVHGMKPLLSGWVYKDLWLD